MPSFFRSDEDVRIFFLKETNTADKKKKYSRLKTIFEQCVRRPGTKGNFFFHRKCATLGNKPILIMEPQGPVDRGIFQGGITKFGETLSGKFECTGTGFITLHVKKNLNEANKLKYGRDIRKVVKRVTGMMSSGGEDRVKIITPKDKERAAKEAAAEKKRLAEEARRRKLEERARRKLRREELARKKAEKRAMMAKKREESAAASSEAPKPRKRPKPKPERPKRERRTRKDAPKQKPKKEKKPKITPKVVEARWEAADTSQEGWLVSEARAQELEVASINISARAESLRNRAGAAYDTLQDSKSKLADLRESADKASSREKAEIKKAIKTEEERQKKLQLEFDRMNEQAIAMDEEAIRQSERLEAAREEAMQKQLAAAQARIAAAQAEQEVDAEDEAEPEDRELAERELAQAARQLQLARPSRASPAPSSRSPRRSRPSTISRSLASSATPATMSAR